MHRSSYTQPAPSPLLGDVRAPGILLVPIAATAWKLAQQSGNEEFLRAAYQSGSRWDAWLRQYRDTRKTGLVEGSCTYDTGHDNSPRWAGIPNQCPDADATRCPPVRSLPRLCPDLSATAYGARMALSAMAAALGRHNEADRWSDDAEKIRRAILARLCCPEDAAFYDRDAEDQFVRVRSDVITRVLGEHVLKLSDAGERGIFEALWKRNLHNPQAFGLRFLLPASPGMTRPSCVRSLVILGAARPRR